MRIGTAARLWDKLRLSAAANQAFFEWLESRKTVVEGDLELCYIPFNVQDALRASLVDPPATLLVLPNGWVKVVAALPHICADLRHVTLLAAWDAYRDAWRQEAVRAAIHRAAEDESRHAESNIWQRMPAVVHA